MEGSVKRQNINRISGAVPVIMSVMALLLATTAGVAGWEKGATDEGALAHIFQLLIVVQVPFILAFLLTANWGRILSVARPLAFQTLAIVLAFAPVAYFKL
jgi:predicted neutral ceramidase superfamily lipid hydrolase